MSTSLTQCLFNLLESFQRLDLIPSRSHVWVRRVSSDIVRQRMVRYLLTYMFMCVCACICIEIFV